MDWQITTNSGTKSYTIPNYTYNWSAMTMPVELLNAKQTKGTNMNVSINQTKNGFTANLDYGHYNRGYDGDDCACDDASKLRNEQAKEQGQYSFESYAALNAWLATKLVKA